MGLLPCGERSQISKRSVTHQEEGTQQLEPLAWESSCQFLELSIHVIIASKAGHRKEKQCRDEEELKGSKLSLC